MPQGWRPAASKRSDGSCTILKRTTGTGNLRKKGTQRSLRVAADGKGPLRSEAGKARGMAQCVFSCCILWGRRLVTLCVNALSLCTGVTRDPGRQVALCQWALLYCGRRHCCAGWADGQKGVICSRASALCSCLRTRRARCSKTQLAGSKARCRPAQRLAARLCPCRGRLHSSLLRDLLLPEAVHLLLQLLWREVLLGLRLWLWRCCWLSTK